MQSLCSLAFSLSLSRNSFTWKYFKMKITWFNLVNFRFSFEFTSVRFALECILGVCATLCCFLGLLLAHCISFPLDFWGPFVKRLMKNGTRGGGGEKDISCNSNRGILECSEGKRPRRWWQRPCQNVRLYQSMMRMKAQGNDGKIQFKMAKKKKTERERER